MTRGDAFPSKFDDRRNGSVFRKINPANNRPEGQDGDAAFDDVLFTKHTAFFS